MMQEAAILKSPNNHNLDQVIYCLLPSILNMRIFYYCILLNFLIKNWNTILKQNMIKLQRNTHLDSRHEQLHEPSAHTICLVLDLG